MADTDVPEGYTLDSEPAQDESAPPEGYTLDQPEDPNAPPPGYQLDSEKYTTPAQQAATVAENIGQGINAPLATAYETGTPEQVANVAKYAQHIPGVTGKLAAAAIAIPALIGKAFIGQQTPEAIAARQEQNPGEALAGQFGGNIGLAALSPITELASFGARGLKGAIESGAITANDEIGKAMLGQGDPADAVTAKLLGSVGVGFLAGGLLGQRPQTAAAELRLLQDSKIGSRISDFLAGMGHNAKFLPEAEQKIIPEGINNPKTFKGGQLFFDALHNRAATALVTGLIGGKEAAETEFLAHLALGPAMKKVSQSYISPMLLKAASSGVVKNPSQILEHAAAMTKGNTKLSNAIESVFTAGSAKAAEEMGSENDDEKLKKHIENGGIDEQLNQSQQQQPNPPLPYANGGEIKPMPELNQNNEIANHWPQQNMMLSAAKARISNYLNSQRPSPIQSTLPFDSKIKNPHHEREYNKVIHLANNPLTILNQVKDGSLTPDQMKHFVAMYPEVYNTISKRMTKRLTESQMDEEKKPPYKTRQAMSLFLGSHLDSNVLPQNIQAAQLVFANQNAQKQAAIKSAALSKSSKLAQTPEQSREQDLTKS